MGQTTPERRRQFYALHAPRARGGDVKKHILIVDDEEHLADALAHNLQFEGFSTTIAYDGEEGLHLARTIQFDLVILDIMMPKLDGLEVCRRLRATGSKVPILFLTAKSADADRLLGLKVGSR